VATEAVGRTPAPNGPFLVRRVVFADERTAAREILSIGCDPAAVPWLLPKSRLLAVRIEAVPAFAANLLKQEALAVGADAVVHRGACTLTVERSDVLLLATPGQLAPLVSKLRLQVPTLRAVGMALEGYLKNAESGAPKVFRARDRVFPIGERTYLFGILNTTPDSFSDGGLFESTEPALRRALEMENQGADFIDVGGESTRPGHRSIDAQEEMDRVLPVIRRIRQESSVPISIDTTKAAVARAALLEGADVVNDVWGLRRDPGIATVVAETGAGLVLMHNRGTEAASAGGPPPSPGPVDPSRTTDILASVVDFLSVSLDLAIAAGISRDALVVDPGIGFGVSPEDSMRMIDGLDGVAGLGRPVLIGPSRKSFIGKVLDLPVDRRLLGTAAAVAYGIARGAAFVRVHDIAEMKEVATLADALRASGRNGGAR
jgi:dihydropteroate synthase